MARISNEFEHDGCPVLGLLIATAVSLVAFLGLSFILFLGFGWSGPKDLALLWFSAGAVGTFVFMVRAAAMSRPKEPIATPYWRMNTAST